MSIKQHRRTLVEGDAVHKGAGNAEGRRPTPGRLAAHGLIRAYQLTLSGLVGRQCRHLPSCSDYADEAIRRHGVWAGAWMGAARICRCGPGGTSGLDFVCDELPPQARWYTPWRYGRWRGVNSGP